MPCTGTPSIVTTDGKHHLLTRVDYADRRVVEDFLQDLLNKAPQILPVEEIDPAFAPVISLGREIESIDNLFISPSGRITLVETKLWRNPEATRAVVGQILDYATKLSKWSYSDFEAAAKRGKSPSPLGNDSLYSYVAKKCPDALPEGQFIDEVQKGLSAARFLLLVVGDGIRENLEAMLGRLHSQPQGLFTFCLIEMQIYESPNSFAGRLLIPRVVARTTEVVRAVVRVDTTGQAPVSVTIEEEAEARPRARRRTLSEDDFFREIQDETTRKVFRRLLEFASEIGAELTWRSGGVSIQLPDPNGSRQNLTLFVLTNTGVFYIGNLAAQLDRVSLDKNISYDFARALVSVFPGVTIHRTQPDALSRTIKASELEAKIGAFMDVVRETAAKIVTKSN